MLLLQVDQSLHVRIYDVCFTCNSWYYSAKQYSYGRIEEKISCTLGILEKKNSVAINFLCSVIFL